MEGAAHLFDAHCHICERQIALPEQVRSLRVSRLACMSARESEWAAVRSLASQCEGRVVPFFGVHPWFAHSVEKDFSFLTRLEELLTQHPESFVGEIGLDKVAVTPDTNRCEFDAQLPVFEAQIRLAGKLQRCVSVHCVKADGPIFDLFKRLIAEGAALPPRVMMHSFGGSADMARSFICLPKKNGQRFWFSFSSTINGRSPKTESVIAQIPDDRILIESDHYDVHAVDDCVMGALAMVCEAKKWDEQNARRILWENSTKFFETKKT